MIRSASPPSWPRTSTGMQHNKHKKEHIPHNNQHKRTADTVTNHHPRHRGKNLQVTPIHPVLKVVVHRKINIFFILPRKIDGRKKSLFGGNSMLFPLLFTLQTTLQTAENSKF